MSAHITKRADRRHSKPGLPSLVLANSDLAMMSLVLILGILTDADAAMEVARVALSTQSNH